MSKKTVDFEAIKGFIVKKRIHQGELSDALGINQGTFSDKMKGKRCAKFSEEQKKTIITYLKNLSKEIIAVTK